MPSMSTRHSRRRRAAFNSAVLAATLMRPVTGDSAQFIPRTIGYMVEGIKQTGANVNLREAYP